MPPETAASPSRAPARPDLPRPGDVAAVLRGRGLPGVALLESGLSLDGLGRFSFVAARPRAVAVAEAGRDLELVRGPPGLPPAWPGDPLRAAAALLRRLRPERAPTGEGLPFRGGAILTLSYDLGRRYERLPSSARADAACPDLHVAVYDTVLAFDHVEGAVRRAGATGPGAGLGAAEVEAALAEAAAAGSPPEPPPASPPPASLDAPAYREAVREAKRRIRRGDLFEVNLSRRYALGAVDPDRCYRALRAVAPAPFMADLDLGRGRRLLSASPERFLSLTPAGRAASWPIKGTRPRGASPEEDARLREELLTSEKEAAELAMIVDLVRNDMGRVAAPGSVRVSAPRLAQAWPAVHHTVAVVEAELEAGRDWADLVRAAFPPGSVTGAPKVRAMEVIDDLEPVRRGAYCGAFGYVGWDGGLDLAVGIRILGLEPGRTLAHAGGAVLLGSDPAQEERETVAKARALLRAAAAGA